MNDDRKEFEKKYRRRSFLCLIPGVIGDAAAVILLRGQTTQSPWLALALLLGGMGLSGLLLVWNARAGSREKQAFFTPVSDSPAPDFSLPETAPRELLVHSWGTLNDGYYRVLEGPERYHFVRLRETSLLGMGPTLEQLEEPIDTSGTDEVIRARYRRGFAVNKADIRSLELSFGNYEYRNQGVFCYGVLELEAAGKRRRFHLHFHPDALTPEQVTDFFSAVRPQTRLDTAHLSEGEEKRRKKLERAQAVLEELEGKQNPKIAKALRKWVPIADAASLLLILSWMLTILFRENVPGGLFALLLGIALLPWAGLILAPRYISIIGSMLPEQNWLERRGVRLVSPIFSLVICPASLLLPGLVTVGQERLGEAILIGAGVALLLAGLTALRTPQAKRCWLDLAALGALSLMFCAGYGLAILRLLG